LNVELRTLNGKIQGVWEWELGKWSFSGGGKLQRFFEKETPDWGQFMLR
jgi:hypothetical protein